MKIFPLLTLLCISSLAFAQQEQKPTVAEKVAYSRSIPPSLWKFTSRSGKSLFWGQSNLKYKGSRVWLHVYDAQQPGKTQIERSDGREQRAAIDLFTISKTHHLRRLSSTPFSYRSNGYKSLGVHVLWLDPQTKQKPVIQIALQNPNGLYGLMTSYVFAIFNEGLYKTSVTQQGFGAGNSNAADWNSWNTRFTVDEHGLLTIVFSEGSTSISRETFFRWTGNAFKPFRRQEWQTLDEHPLKKDVPVSDPLQDPGLYDGP